MWNKLSNCNHDAAAVCVFCSTPLVVLPCCGNAAYAPMGCFLTQTKLFDFSSLCSWATKHFGGDVCTSLAVLATDDGTKRKYCERTACRDRLEMPTNLGQIRYTIWIFQGLAFLFDCKMRMTDRVAEIVKWDSTSHNHICEQSYKMKFIA